VINDLCGLKDYLRSPIPDKYSAKHALRGCKGDLRTGTDDLRGVTGRLRKENLTQRRKGAKKSIQSLLCAFA
jgi:hypothetical protein